MVELFLFLGALLALSAVVWGLFRPARDMWERWQQAGLYSERVRREDALKHIYKCEMAGRTPRLDNLAGALHLPLDDVGALLEEMASSGLLSFEGGEIQLSDRGRESAVHIIRAHRLWERYLAEETGFAEVEWHEQADRWEHRLTPERTAALAARLGNPTHDPHGDPIPSASGTLVSHGGQPLTQLGVGTLAQIVHVEDEPESLHAQIVAAAVYVGMRVRIVESTPERVRFVSRDDEHVLAPIVANNISAVALPPTETLPTNGGVPLVELQLGESARVMRLSPACRGAERRRLLDLGVLPGTSVLAELRSPSGDPTAYRIRGALIALRSEQARLIIVEQEKDGEADG